jgi:hypothetical protein
MTCRILQYCHIDHTGNTARIGETLSRNRIDTITYTFIQRAWIEGLEIDPVARTQCSGHLRSTHGTCNGSWHGRLT